MDKDKLIKILKDMTTISYLYTGGGPDLAILRFKDYEQQVDRWWEDEKQQDEWIESIANNIIEEYENI